MDIAEGIARLVELQHQRQDLPALMMTLREQIARLLDEQIGQLETHLAAEVQTVIIPEPVRYQVEREREGCNNCWGRCGFRFSHTEHDEELGTLYAFTCIESGECGFYEANGYPNIRVEHCGVEKYVYQDDGQLVWQG